MSQQLHIRLLGGFDLTLAGTHNVPVQTAALQVLVAFLLLHRQTPQSRQYLAFLLYPESSERQALSNLRTLFLRLRQVFPEATDFIHIEHHTVQWRPDARFTLDVTEFEETARRALTSSTRTDLERAVELYRGDLLPGCYDDWILPERERLRQVFLHVLEELIRVMEAQREYSKALVHAQHLLQLDPLQETTYQLLMRLYASRGDRANVVRTFQKCETVLRQELGAEPGAHTRQLFEQLQKSKANEILTHTVPRTRNDLPVPLTRLIGRAQELAEVKRRLTDSRLVTLTGVGGGGKTRLALEVARELAPEFADGVGWIELASLYDPNLIPQAISSVLDVGEQPGRPLIETLQDRLESKQLLLVLESCEHLLGACALLALNLLRRCAHLKILATSREGLGIVGENVYIVPPLAFPERMNDTEWQAVQEYPASQLFIERAQAVLPTFALTRQNASAIVQVCARLDGIPLAIELAAARVNLLSPREIAGRLRDRFALLTSRGTTADPRHQTLRAMVDASYDLLDGEEKTLLQTLAVFAGGFTIEAAEQVSTLSNVLDLIARLVDKSLVSVTVEHENESVRSRLLETIRAYAWEELRKAGEADVMRDRHLEWCITLAEHAAPELARAEQALWLKRLANEADNFRAALDWATASGAIASGLRLATGLWMYWELRGMFTEGQAWFQALLSKPVDSVPPSVRGNALCSLSALLYRQGNLAHAAGVAQEALAVLEFAEAPAVLARTLNLLGAIHSLETNFSTALEFYERSLEIRRQLNDTSGMAHALHNLGYVAHKQEDPNRAIPYLEECILLRRSAGDQVGVASALTLLGEIEIYRGHYARAATLYQESLTVQRALDIRVGVANATHCLGLVAYYQGKTPEARTLFDESWRVANEIGNKRALAWATMSLGDIAQVDGKDGSALAHYERALTLHREMGEKEGIALTSIRLAAQLVRLEDNERAVALLSEAYEIYRALGLKRGLALTLEGLAEFAATTGNLARAAQFLGAASALRGAANSPPHFPASELIARVKQQALGQLPQAEFDAAFERGRVEPLAQFSEACVM